MSPDTTTCEDGTNRPFLKIVEQPTPKFRFRYRSEMQGTHGAIQGEKATKQKKTFPTVKLCNYENVAYIRCTLYSSDESNRHIHAHRLVAKSPDRKEDKDDPHDVKVGPVNSYEACFQTMVIIHTPRKLIIEELIKKKKLQIISRRPLDGANLQFPDETLRRMTSEAKRENEVMDMNKVSLRFDALKEDPVTGELVEICKPVYSIPIQNMKSHLTADLKICRIDKHIASCRGGEEVFIFVEKVSKKNIKVRFFELNEDEEESWCDYAKFTETDVHHQYAIAFRTPPYKDLKIDQYVTVYIQLERPSDKCVSEKIDFQYKPEYQITSGSKRKAVEDIRLPLPSPQLSPQLPDTTGILVNDPNFDSLNSLSGLLGGLDIPMLLDDDEPIPEIHHTIESNPSLTKELEKMQSANSQEFKRFMASICPEDLEAYVRSLSDDEDEIRHINNIAMDLSADDSNVNVDGITIHKGRKMAGLRSQFSDDVVIDGASTKKGPLINRGKKLLSGGEVPRRQLTLSKENLPELVINVVKKMKRVDKHMVNKEILHRLELLFSDEVDKIDRDSVLHMAVMYDKERELEILLSILKTYNMLTYVDSKNKEVKTPLHVAAQLKSEKSVELLLSYKADPNIQDTFGNTALHYATTEQSYGIVKRLVSAMETREIDARNVDGLTALHIAVGQKLYDIVEALLQACADVNVQNGCTGDTLLHIAINNRDTKMVNILLKEERININIKNYAECIPLDHLFLDSSNMEAKQEICDILLEYESNPKNDKPLKTDAEYERVVRDLVKSYIDVKKEEPDMIEVDGQLVAITKKVKQEFFSNEELNIMDVDIRNSPPSGSNNMLAQGAAAAVYVSEDEIKKEKSESDDDEVKYSKQSEYFDEKNLDKHTLDDEQNYDDLGDLGIFDNTALSELCPLLDGNGGWKLLAIRLGFREFLPNFSKHWSPTFLLLLYVDKYYSKTLRDIKDHLVELNQNEAASALERLIKRNAN